MQYLNRTLPNLNDNLALDEALLLAAEAGQGGEILRLWEWPNHAVVLGAAGILTEDIHESACLDDHVPVARRASGGGTVLLGDGCLVYSLVLRYERADELTQIGTSYRYILDRVAGALRVSCALAGTSDLASAGQKFSGNAQQRKRNHLLHHGTLLYNFDFTILSRYLKQPARQPEYRQQRNHLDFLRNLEMDRDQIEEALRTTWRADEVAPSWPTELVERLVAEKYSTEKWIRRR